MYNNKKGKYFVSFINGYFPALHSFSVSQNYYLYPLLLALELGYKPIAIVQGGVNVLRSDPHFDSRITVIEYKNFFQYSYLIARYSFLRAIFYINTHSLPSYFSLVLTKLLACPSIFMGHIQPKRTTKLRQIIFNWVLFFVDRVRLNNESEKKFLSDCGIDRKKLYVVPIAINGSVFYKNNFDYSSRKDVVYYGNTTNQKGLPTIFEAVAIIKKEIPDIKLHIVGSRGDYNPEEGIQRYNLKDNVVLHGAFSHGVELNNLLNRFSVFVISTKGEGQCLAVYESALAGNALCLPKIMSFEDVFKDKALFHDLGDADGLANVHQTYTS